MNKTLAYILFALRHLPKFMRMCAQLLEEFYKFEKAQSDEVGVL